MIAGLLLFVLTLVAVIGSLIAIDSHRSKYVEAARRDGYRPPGRGDSYTGRGHQSFVLWKRQIEADRIWLSDHPGARWDDLRRPYAGEITDSAYIADAVTDGYPEQPDDISLAEYRRLIESHRRKLHHASHENRLQELCSQFPSAQVEDATS